MFISIDKYTEIERENKILYEKMMNITKRTPFFLKTGKYTLQYLQFIDKE